MANYESALTGQQMDAALTDVALRNSEAWAVGTRNGVNVTSADETWHNNAKYYAQVAQSAIPGTYTAAVRWDIAQGLAGESQEQARANISAGASNRNLLDNPWFGSGEVVNQRGVTTFTSNTFNIDRWTYYTSTTSDSMTLTDSGIASTYSSGYHHIAQRIPQVLYNSLIGKTATLSVLFSDGTILSGTGTIPETTFINFIAQSTGTNGIIQGSNQTVYFRAYNNKTIRAVKLEKGSYSTLANDVPPDYGEELRKCQRYFVRIASSANAFPVGFGVKDSATIADIFVPTPVEMRVTPSTSKNGTHRVWGGNAASRDVSSYSTVAKTTTGVYLRATISSGSLADYYTYVIYLQSGAYIDLSADL